MAGVAKIRSLQKRRGSPRVGHRRALKAKLKLYKKEREPWKEVREKKRGRGRGEGQLRDDKVRKKSGEGKERKLLQGEKAKKKAKQKSKNVETIFLLIKVK